MLYGKLKRIFSAVTALCLILPALSSCHTGAGDESQKESGGADKIEIDLSRYTVVRPSDTDEATITAAKCVYEALAAACGGGVALTDDWLRRGEEPDSNSKEILVGSTNRKESQTAAGEIGGYGWIIKRDGNKICIGATDTRLLKSAAEAFVSGFVSVSDRGRLTLTEDILLTEKSDPKLNDYTIVLRKGRGSYEEEEAVLIAQFIGGALGGDVRLISETDRIYSDAAYEILIGDVVCPEVGELKKELGAAEYGVFFRGNKIILYGWSLATTIESAEAFLGLLKKQTSVGPDGKFTLASPAACDIKLTHTGWNTDFPRFTGGKGGLPDGTYDCGYGELAYFYSGTTEAEVKAYRSALEADGYALCGENKIGTNSFSVYKKSDGALYLMRNASSGLFRVISARAALMVPAAGGSNSKVTGATITQMCLDYTNSDVGMSYIITLEDGRFVIIDGGHPLESEAYDLLRQLKSMNTIPGKPVIAAWIITHTHSDHSGVFRKFSELCAASVILESLMVNIPSKYTYYNTNHGSFFYPEIEAALKNYPDSPALVIPKTGDVLSLSGAEIEFLYTHVDYYPNNFDVFNDFSLVFRLNIAGQTILFLGDVQTDAAGVIAGMYGAELKSDMVQMAHHGFSNGGSKELYALIDPSVIFWPSSPSLYESRKATGVGGYVIGSLNVKKIIKATTETITIKLPYYP